MHYIYMMHLYNQIGKDYNTTRNADPYLVAKIVEYLDLKLGEVHLDIGCGTGNYLKALNQLGFTFHGVDPSQQMLQQAKHNNPTNTLIEAAAEQLPFPDLYYDAAIGILTIHHWQDKLQGLIEVNRVLKPNGKLLLFSFSPQQIMGYWLHHYFPAMIQQCSLTTLPEAQMELLLRQSGFKTIQSFKYYVREDLQDHFLYSYKFKPKKYLLEEVRNGTSGFRAMCNADELVKGLALLERDIQTGAIIQVMKNYENDFGDYLFLLAEK